LNPRQELAINCHYLCEVSRILAIDFGSKKSGLAVTDPLRIIAAPLETVPTVKLFEYLDSYLDEQEVSLIVIGEPFLEEGIPSQFHEKVMKFAKKIKKRYPDMVVEFQDESNSSKTAKNILLHSGAKKGKRRDKNLIDKIAASIILEDYLKEKGIF